MIKEKNYPSRSTSQVPGLVWSGPAVRLRPRHEETLQEQHSTSETPKEAGSCHPGSKWQSRVRSLEGLEGNAPTLPRM